MRRLISFAASPSVLRRSSLIRRLFSLALSRSFSSCSSVKLCRLSLALSCSFARCSSVKFCLHSLILSRSLPRCTSVTFRLHSLILSCSLFRCSSVKLVLLSLFLSCSISRCSLVQSRLLSLALWRSLSRWAWLACRLLSRFLCLSLCLYSKLEDIMNENSRKWECKNNFCQPIQKKNNFFLLWVDFAELLSCLCLTKRGNHSFSRQKNNLVPRIQNPHCTHRPPPIFHWRACGADGRSFVRCTVTWLPNFLGWGDYLSYGASPTRARSARRAALLPLVDVFSISCILILTKVTRVTDLDVTLYPYPHSSVVTQY